jgi:hypothetical protein
MEEWRYGFIYYMEKNGQFEALVALSQGQKTSGY